GTFLRFPGGLARARLVSIELERGGLPQPVTGGCYWLPKRLIRVVEPWLRTPRGQPIVAYRAIDLQNITPVADRRTPVCRKSSGGTVDGHRTSQHQPRSRL